MTKLQKAQARRVKRIELMVTSLMESLACSAPENKRYLILTKLVEPLLDEIEGLEAQMEAQMEANS